MLSEEASENKPNEQNQNSHLFGLVRHDPGVSLVLDFFFFFYSFWDKASLCSTGGWLVWSLLHRPGCPKHKGIYLPPPPKCEIKGV